MPPPDWTEQPPSPPSPSEQLQLLEDLEAWDSQDPPTSPDYKEWDDAWRNPALQNAEDMAWDEFLSQEESPDWTEQPPSPPSPSEQLQLLQDLEAWDSQDPPTSPDCEEWEDAWRNHALQNSEDMAWDEFLSQEELEQAEPTSAASLRPPGAAVSTDTSGQSTSAPSAASPEELRAGLLAVLPAKDANKDTPKTVRRHLERYLGLSECSLDARADEITEMVKSLVQIPAQPHQDGEDLGEETKDASKSVYLVTFPHPKQEKNKNGITLKAPSSYTRKQIAQALLRCVELTQGLHLTPLLLLKICIFREKHSNDDLHDHGSLLGSKCFRFNPMKQALLREYGLASHWSCTHTNYASAVAYGYLPSLKKSLLELDASPYLWPERDAPELKAHPPLAEASRMPVTAAALEERREKQRQKKAEAGKKENKFKDIDLWPIVVAQNILAEAGAAERLMAYAKRCGGVSMVEYVFRNWDRLDSLVERSWKVEKVPRSNSHTP